MWVEISDLWLKIAAGLGAIVLIWNAFNAIKNLLGVASAPNRKQDERLKKLEERLDEVEKSLTTAKGRFDTVDTENRIILTALSALLDHGIDGNHIEPLKKAKEELQAHLINK